MVLPSHTYNSHTRTSSPRQTTYLPRPLTHAEATTSLRHLPDKPSHTYNPKLPTTSSDCNRFPPDTHPSVGLPESLRSHTYNPRHRKGSGTSPISPHTTYPLRTAVTTRLSSLGPFLLAVDSPEAKTEDCTRSRRSQSSWLMGVTSVHSRPPAKVRHEPSPQRLVPGGAMRGPSAGGVR